MNKGETPLKISSLDLENDSEAEDKNSVEINTQGKGKATEETSVINEKNKNGLVEEQRGYDYEVIFPPQ